MPQIPYTPYSTEQPQGGGERVQVSAPPAAFGVNVAQAVEGLGGQLEKSGDELFTRAMALQDLRNETDAREAQTQYAEKSSELHAQYGAKEGKDAADGLQDYIKAQADLRQQFRNGLKTQFAQRYYDRDTLPFMQRNVFSAAGHAADQNKASVIGTAEAQKFTATKTFVDPGSESEFQHKQSMSNDADDTIAAAKGFTAEQTTALKLQSQSKLWLGRINALAVSGDTPSALKMIEANKTNMTEDDSLKALTETQSQHRNIGSRVDADGITADLRGIDPNSKRPERSLQEYLNEADKVADKNSFGDPAYKDFVRSRVETQYRSSIAARRDFQFDNQNTVAGALMGSGTNGAIPTSPEELRAAGPKVAAAWDNLPETVQRSYMSAMANNAKGDHSWTVDGLKRYQQLKGMASDDPAGFLDMSVVGENIPMSARKGLVDLQQKIKNDSAGDPRLTRAWSILEPTLQSAGILDDKDQRQQFRGALTDAIQDFQTEHKKSPNVEETKLIGTQLMQQFKTQKWFFNRNVPLFQAPIPDDLLKDVKKKATDSGQPLPSDEQIRREYVRQNYQKLYGSSAKKPTTGKGNPPFSSPVDNYE